MIAALQAREPLPGELGEGVQLIDPLHDPRWDPFVARHPWGWLTHLSGWKRMLDRNFPHMRGYYLALEDGAGGIEAALPIYSLHSWLTGNRLISVPFATLCDPLATESAQIERLWRAVLALSALVSIGRIEIHTLASSRLLQGAGLKSECRYRHHSLSLGGDPELVLGKFHRSCVRQRISRAGQSGLELVKGSSLEDLQQFYRLYRGTRQRRGLPSQPYRMIQSLWQEFGAGTFVELLLCRKGGKAIAGIVLLKYKGRVSAEYAASDPAFNHCSPNHFLFWQAIREACLSGCTVFDFGQTPADNGSLLDFKSHWGTEVRDLHHFIHPDHEAGRTLLHHDPKAKGVLRVLCRFAPAPALNCLGAFCYRHLG